MGAICDHYNNDHIPIIWVYGKCSEALSEVAILKIVGRPTICVAGS